MKLTVMTMGMVKVEGSSLAEEVEMRNKLQALGVPCTPIEFEGSVDDCLEYVMGKSESELDEDEDRDDDAEIVESIYKDRDDDDYRVLTDNYGQPHRVNVADIVQSIYENGDKDVYGLEEDDVYEMVKDYLYDHLLICATGMDFFVESGQLEGLTDMVCDRLW